MSEAASILPMRQMSARDVFQWLSYAQYPAMLVALGYAFIAGLALVKAKQAGMAPVFDLLNYVLLYAGVGIGLSSLQDPTRTQNKVSLKAWQNPRMGRLMLCVLAAQAFIPIIVGLIGAYLADSMVINQLSLGFVAFGLGMIGLLKTAIEMREHHRLDRAPEGGRA